MPDYQNYKLTARHVFKDQAVCDFKSKGEVQHAVWLEFMRRAGKIKRWQHEKTFFLRGAGISSARHSPDFLITTNNDRKIVHEIKDGIYSLVWRNKKRRFEKQHPSIKYVVLRRPGTLPNGVVREKWCQDLIKKLKQCAIEEETSECVRLIKKPLTRKKIKRMVEKRTKWLDDFSNQKFERGTGLWFKDVRDRPNKDFLLDFLLRGKKKARVSFLELTEVCARVCVK